MNARPVVAILGAGAAGTLTALHLVRESGRRSTPVEILLVDPADRWGRGTAFGTTDDQHLLNVPAAGMSALPEDPSHFLHWLQDQQPDAHAFTFAPRRTYGRYLDEQLTAAARDILVETTVRHVRATVTDVRRDGARVRLGHAGSPDGLLADAVVVAVGLPTTGEDWAPPALRDSPFFVTDPWAPGALDPIRRDRTGPADVLVVGTGLTAVDVLFSLAGTRPDRRLHTVSRSGRLPSRHADRLKPAAIPDISGWGARLEEIRTAVEQHLTEVAKTTGDWRPALDGLRFRVAELWQRLPEEDRTTFLLRDAAAWNRLRHRIPTESHERLDGLVGSGEIVLGAASVTAVEPLAHGGLRVATTDEAVREVGWVVNCTGPRADVRTLGNPVLDDLLRPRLDGALAVTTTAGMGLATRDGRLVDGRGRHDAPIWTLGALRRGELWESTAVPEIRQQALALAVGVLEAVAPLPRRLADGTWVPGHHPVARPRDPLGLPLSTTAEAAAVFNAGLERLMRLQSGAEELFAQAAALDPDFALAHAALALLGHEAGADTDVTAALAAARRAARTNADDRERSLVSVVGLRIREPRRAGADALRRHIAAYPRDVLAVSAAVPTIAFSGVIDVQQDVWALVENLAPAYGDHWWYISLLAFVRQDQARYDEAALLAESALSCEPSSGHAVHALAHVHYETGQHETGRAWLDHWIDAGGRSASHRAHFAWHAALHELALGDVEAVRARFARQLADVTGVRGLVDTASLLWRWQVAVTDWDTTVPSPPTAAPVLAAVGSQLLGQPETPFIALHAAVAHAANHDAASLDSLGTRCRRSRDEASRSAVAPVCRGLAAVLREDWSTAVTELSTALPGLTAVGGSAAQREIVEETLLLALWRDGRTDVAREVLGDRVDRRHSPLDERRLRLTAG
ncbi:FAD/NAD(P)-binding protein [Nocardioides jiangxiensis]|uniref:FAD/NAD(P)-binding protein n=1 Tax=Nocardioides jiangxiensis TaxID=3064524 RepID=A0ABT9AYD9_9ACTN|nr:FAD/NAD(P)-binding protein [Nocardioides sp. WY-20]MDO7867591.1 FAD/NAD(P)-binding protein [Nocardioides sp. WY-20]